MLGPGTQVGECLAHRGAHLAGNNESILASNHVDQRLFSSIGPRQRDDDRGRRGVVTTNRAGRDHPPGDEDECRALRHDRHDTTLPGSRSAIDTNDRSNTMWFGLGIIGLIIWIAIAFWPARVAGRKGHSFIGYFLLSLLFFPLSLIMAYTVQDRTAFRAA
jgi:hypothetical protein